MMMHTETKIKKLLEQYLEGKTGLKDEKILSEYFKNNNIRPEWNAYRQMFQYFEDNGNEKSEKTFQPKTKKSDGHFFKYAAVLLIAVAGAWFYNYQHNTEDLGTYDDPKAALEETKKAFDLISYHLNTGQMDMKYLETLDKTKTKYIDNIAP